ncbi:MAG: hypothetical protein IKT57_03625 [Clostridia bacterium]|nr:hypothetical protein [Clostridia bacterium]
MKKIVALLMVGCLLFSSCGGALASAPITDYTLEDKWELQMQGSGFKGQVSFAVEGDYAFGMDESLWQTLRMLLPAVTLDIRSMPRSENRDTQVQVLIRDEESAYMKVLTDGQQYVLRSNLLGEDEYNYAFDKQFDPSRLFTQGDEGKWPDLNKTLLRILTADEGWKEKAEPMFSVYTSRIALWMQEYMQVNGLENEDGYQTYMGCSIPAEDVKVFIKRMLAGLFEDEEMLSLLREVLTKDEQAAYLDKGNQEIFFIMLDLLPMEGDVEIQRVYDEKGTLILDTITLPFAENSSLSLLNITVQQVENLPTTTVSGSYRDGRSFEVNLRRVDEDTWTGSVRMDVAADEEKQLPAGVRAFVFNCAYDAGEETYDLENDLCQHLSDLSVLIKPAAEDTTGIRETTLSVRMDKTSKSSRRAATYITVDAALTDQESGSVLAMNVKCNTASPWTPDLIAGLETAPIRLDEMPLDEQQELGQMISVNADGWFRAQLMKLMSALEE